MDTDGIYGHEVDGELTRAAKIVDKAFARVLKLPDVSKRGQNMVKRNEEALKSQ